MSREYLNVEQLAALSPWSEGAIHDMVDRGVFKLGVHFFQPGGRRSRLIFKWSEVVGYIEGSKALPAARKLAAAHRGSGFNVEEAESNLSRLLGQSGR